MINSPKEVANHCLEIGKNKASLPAGRMFLLAVLAGMFIALGAVGANTVSCLMENGSAAKIAAGVIFPAGLAMVVIAGGELFTGNCLILLSVLGKRTSAEKMLRNWIIVYLGNFVGAIFVAWGVYAGGQTQLFQGALLELTIQTAVTKCGHTFGEALLLGVFCNFLVCIAVWMGFAGKTAVDKIVGLFFPIFLFVASGYEHSVANMYYIPAGIFSAGEAGQSMGLTWSGFLFSNLLPVTIGNILGGALLVAGIYYLVYIKGESQT
ncbi:formate/nitrite transporter family protein [Anaerotignum lactatifermentans]|uniref:formate/nitrite transporter family protein n=1 Tax=Anaerotignum lactatifermentans TaxID=160404 RepID=UPI001A9CAA9D|nr:formate/nitrite transporter family protein [Anaerotignum lactatifermentans]